MTKEKAKELLPLLQAYSEGKVIQYQENSGKWVDLENPDFACDAIYYRIKPEEEWQPYKDCDEMIADFKERSNTTCMPLIWVKDKVYGRKYLITGFDASDDAGIYFGCNWYDFEDLFANYTYLDDTVCGVKQ